jgi:Arc/MetJ family transcription regulator
MSRTVINLDDELCAQAAQILGTKTKVSTVNAALKEIVNRQRRMNLVNWLADGGLEFEDHKELRRLAWG